MGLRARRKNKIIQDAVAAGTVVPNTKEDITKAAVARGLSVPSKRSLGSGRSVFFRREDYTLKNSELLFSAVSRIANALSAMPIQLYKGTTPVYNRLNDLVACEPSTVYTSCTFFKTLEACRSTAGNCYALKVYDGQGRLQRLDILDPGKVTPLQESETGELWYKVQPDTGESFYIHNFYMVHVPFLSTNGFKGISPVHVLMNTLDYSQSIQEFSVTQLKKGLNASIVLEAPAQLGETQKKAMIETFMSTYKETSGNILLLESGVLAKSLNLSPVDSKLFEVEKITRSKVAMVYNIPPHLLGDYSDVSFASQEQQTLEFSQMTMLPIVTAYEQELNRKLLTRELRMKGYRFCFNMDAILRADAATQAEVDQKLIRSACILPDEVRGRRNLPSLPDGIGSQALISQDLATLDYTVNVRPKVEAVKLNQPPKEPAA